MKKFLKYLCLFSLPLLLCAIGLEYMLRQVPNPYTYKRYLLEKKGEGIKNMIIGSSVVDYGIDPSYLPDSTYNLAISGQWFRYNEAQLEKYIDDLPHLKRVIWGVSFQALWSDEYEEGVFFQIRKEDSEIAYHKIYMDLSFDNDWRHSVELISTWDVAFEKWSKHYILRDKTMYCDSLGLDHKDDLSDKEDDWLTDIPRSMKMHTALKNEKAERVYRQNVQRMNNVAKLCHDRGIELYIVIPPTYRKYYELADSAQLQKMYGAIEQLADKWDNVYWYDYFKDDRFEEDDFHDGNHLTSDVGAVKFAKILNEDLFNGDVN